jgi:hypothetical protein
MNQIESLFSEHRRKCPVCGKKFFSTGLWVYKTGYRFREKYFCSWGCLRKDEKEHQTIDDQINRMIRDGLNDREIRSILGVSQAKIDFRKGRK